MQNLLRLSGIALLWAANVFGQASAINGELTGTVTDPSGAAIAGAKVQATNTQTGLKPSVTTNETGLYRITLLPVGPYELEVQAAGFGTKKITGIALTAGSVATVDIAMTLAGTATTVEVTTAGIVTEPSRIDVGSTLDENMTRNLP